MKIIKITALTIALLLSNNSAFSDFSSTSTIVDWEKTFEKVHWENRILYVHEDYVVNPFSWSSIVRNQTNNSTTSYSVDNRIFNSSHPKYKNNWATMQWWTDHWDGTQTMIKYLENTYTRDGSNILMPNQSVTVRKYYKVDFNYDTSWPTGGDLKLYNDENATQAFSYTPWTWLNEPKYYTMTCNDPETGCKCDFNLDKTSENGWIDDNNHACTNSTEIVKVNGVVRTVPSIIWHMTSPKVSFENNVNLRTDDITGTMPGGNKVMYDQSNPRVWLGVTQLVDWINQTVIDFNLWNEDNRDYRINPATGKQYDWEQIPWKVYFDSKKIVDIKANDQLKLGVVFTDQYITDSANGVSWIKNYNIKIYKKDNSGNYPTTAIYNFSKSYGEYNPDWTKQVSDDKWKLLNDFWVLKKSWEYKIILEAYDWANNHTQSTSYLNIYPEGISEANISLEYNSDSWDKFANNNDYYQYIFTIRDKYNNPVHDKEMDIIGQDCWDLTSWCLELTENTIDWSWESALLIYDVSNNWVTDVNWQVRLKIRSVSPGAYTNSFLVKVRAWNQKYIDTNEIIDFYVFKAEETNFMPPFEMSEIKVSDDWVNWDSKPEIWKEQKYRIIVSNTGSISGYDNWVLRLNQESIKSKVDWHFWINFEWVERNFWNNINSFLGFSWTIDGSANLLKWPEVENDELEITYEIPSVDKKVVYKLDSVSIKGCDRETLWLKVEWNIQWDGKSDITWQEENFSDLSLSDTRSIIRQNAYQLIRNMSNGQVLNWVKFIDEQDYVLEANPSFETLIVREWNVIINKDINTWNNKLWIIVLKDKYDVASDYNKAWNIYIANNVNSISAALYSDGTMRSAKSNWTNYSDSELLNDLEIFWTVFTRNTIGWAVNWGTSYTLPGWQETTDYELASSYDLNYLRKSMSCWDDYALLIKYNSALQVNPPKGFSK